jgi:hypothetical protein
MKRWQIDETKSLMEGRYGSSQVALAKRCLNSACNRQIHARYHFMEAKRLLSEHIDGQLPEKSIYELTLPTDGESASGLNYCLVRVEANILACAQALHSLEDILSHVVYFASGLNLSIKAIPEQNIRLSTVMSALDSDPSFKEVCERLHVLSSHPQFEVVNAIVNHSKHRGIVETALHVDPFNANDPYELHFESFWYKGRTHVEQEVGKVLEPAYEAISQAVVEVGNAINQALTRRDP